jgi:hypothetical protein
VRGEGRWERKIVHGIWVLSFVFGLVSQAINSATMVIFYESSSGSMVLAEFNPQLLKWILIKGLHKVCAYCFLYSTSFPLVYMLFHCQIQLASLDEDA